MNKLTKVGLSALCGSLAAVSTANAGEMTVTGGVDMSWGSSDQTTGNPLGIGSNLTFKGGGELDNGWTFDVTVAMLNDDAYSAADVNIGMGGLGTLNLNQGNSGNGIDAFDDKMPTAWEEPWGMGLGTGVQLVSGAGTSQNVMYTTPTLLGTTLTLTKGWNRGQADGADNATGGATAGDETGAVHDGTININPSFGTEILSGLNIFAGASTTDSHLTAVDDRYEGVAGVTYDLGPVSLGVGRQGIYTGKQVTGSDVSYYSNQQYGIAFNINDNLSVSYGRHKSQQVHVNPDVKEDQSLDMESYQIAYTMGGASLRFADSSVQNAAYQSQQTSDTSFESRGFKVISVSLAF